MESLGTNTRGEKVGIQIFGQSVFHGSRIKAPNTCVNTEKWIPKICETFFNFKASTTQGGLYFENWAKGSWTLLLSHPAAKTSVCTTEIGTLACSKERFEAINTQILSLTSSSLAELDAWHKDIKRVFESEVWFPCCSDTDQRLSRLFGMQHEKEHTQWPIRKSFIIDPNRRIRAILEYPINVGRCVDKTIRIIAAMQLNMGTGYQSPSDWFDGDPVIVPNDIAERDILRISGTGSVQVLPYLRVVAR